jgi:hypothetical protein
MAAIIPKLKEQSGQLGRGLAASNARIEESLAQLQRSIDENGALQNRLAKSVEQVSKAIGPAVVGLQFQDITRQKWEHVQTAVAAMRARCCRRGLCRWVLPMDSIGFLRDTSRLQVLQLRSIEEDLERAQSAIGSSIQTMLQHLKDMDAEGQHMSGHAAGADALEKVTEALQTALAETRNWMEQITSVSRTTSEAVALLDRKVSDVAGTLRKLSVGISLIAINAQVQAAHVGDQTGLSVLSEFTCSTASAIHRFSNKEGAQFDKVVRELSQIIDDCRKLWEQTREQQQWLDGQGHTLDGQMVSSRNTVLASMKTLNESLGQVHQEAASALETVDFKTSFREGFAGIRETLEECSSLAGLLHGEQESSDSVKVHIDRLKSNYTMGSERSLHEAATGKTGNDSAVTAPPAPTGIPSGADASKTPPETTSDPPSENDRKVPEAGTKPSAFGDNVELF